MTKADADQNGWRGTDQGNQLKTTTGWGSGGNGTNAVGFNALPGGYRAHNEVFIHLGSDGYWWSATEENSDMAWCRIMSTAFPTIHRAIMDKQTGFAVRCIKN